MDRTMRLAASVHGIAKPCRIGAVRSPPMGRKLFTLTSAVSTLLCAAALALWAFSYTRAIAWDRYVGAGYQAICSDRGYIVFSTQSANESVRSTWRFRSA